MDDVVYSGASNEIVVGGADGVADVAAAGFKVFARNGRLVVDAAEAAPVTVVDAYGRESLHLRRIRARTLLIAKDL